MKISWLSAYLLRIFIILMVLIAVIGVKAETQSSELTLHELLVYGLQNSPTLAAAESDLLVAEYRVGERRSVFLPQADLGIEYADVNKFNVVEEGEITGQRSRRRTDTITVSQTIYNAVHISQWRRSKLEYDYSVLQRDLVAENLLSDILGLFIDFHLQKVSLELLENKMQHLLKQRELLQLKEDTGSGSAIEVIRMEQGISVLDTELHEAEFALITIRADLADIAGIPNSNFDLKMLSYAADASGLLLDETADFYTSGAVINALELRDLHFKLQLAEQDVAIEASGRWPNLYLEYQYDHTDVPGQDDERSISINMSWSLFDGWASHYQRLTSIDRLRLAQRQYDEGLSRLQRKFTRLKREIDTGLKLYSINAIALENSEAIVTTIEMGASYGSRNTLDILQAINDYFDSRQTQFILFAQILRNVNELWQVSNSLSMTNLRQLSAVLHGD